MKRASEATIPIDRHIQQHREALVKQAERLPDLRERLQRVESAQTSCAARRCTRRRASDLERDVRRLRDEIERLETGAHLEEFERSVAPFLDAYVRHSGATRRKASRVVVPGEQHARFEPSSEGGGATTVTQGMVVAEYLCKVQGEAPRAKFDRTADACPNCADTPMVLVPAKAIVACPKCGRSAAFLDATSASISYDTSTTPEMTVFSYKRCNHFHDWLVNVQGLESYKVPQEVMERVMAEFARQRIVDLDDITTRSVRDVLKGMRGMRRYYEHVAQICAYITGRPPPRLTDEAQQIIKLMFTAIQEPFARHCPASRKNFLSYSFILSKMLWILGFDDLAASLTMLKGRDKLLKMDQVTGDPSPLPRAPPPRARTTAQCECAHPPRRNRYGG